MSDEVSYFVGDTLGRDHQQWPTILRSQIADYGLDPGDADRIWPADITLDQLMAIALRVRKWRLEGTSTVQESGSVPGPISFNATSTAALGADLETFNGDNVVATRERDLISLPYDLGSTFIKFLANNGTSFSPFNQAFSAWNTTGDVSQSGVVNGDGTATAFALFSNALVLFDPDTQLFSPAFQGPGSFVESYLLATASVNRNPVTSTSGFGSGFLKAPGSIVVDPVIAPPFTIPLQLEWRFAGQASNTTYTGSGDLELTLTATEFWPWANSAALPVFDSASGAQLRDPFS